MHMRGSASTRRSFVTAPLVLLAFFFLFNALSLTESFSQSRWEGEGTVPFFASAGEEAPGTDESPPGTLRSRTVEVHPRFFEERLVKPGMRITVAPFEGRSFTAVLDKTGTDVNGVFSFRASVEGFGFAYLIVSTGDGFALGLLDIPEWGLRFELEPDPGRGRHVVREVDSPAARRSELEGGAPLLPREDGLPAASARAAGPFGPESDAAEVNIDLMIVYTSAAAVYASSRGGINLVIAQTMQQSQLALDNSNAGILLRLIYSTQVDYQESGSSYTDLDRLTYTNDGYMDEIHGWRNLHGADMVNFLADVDDVGGLAWLLTNPAGRPDRAFSLVRVRQAQSGYTFIHELGHNLGCHHRKNQNEQPGPGIYSYSAGWRWVGDDGLRYCSVMSYTDMWDGNAVTRVAHFSSPLISHRGAFTGEAADGDNARTLRETRGIVSNYRAESSGDYWLTIRATEGGTTVPAPGNYSYPPGSVVQVTAQPHIHYDFLGWSGNATGAANPVSITMDGSKSITADFQRRIYSPRNARGVKVLNRSLSQAEYINVLTWEANPDNEDIVKYAVYLVGEAEKKMLAIYGSDVFEFRHRKVDKDGVYVYWIVAVNDEEREGEPAVLAVQ